MPKLFVILAAALLSFPAFAQTAGVPEEDHLAPLEEIVLRDDEWAAAQDSAVEMMQSSTTFAVCKGLDIATTAYALNYGFVEKNPIVAASLHYGYAPIIALSVGLWYLMDKYATPEARFVSNVMTCGVGMHNLYLLIK